MKRAEAPRSSASRKQGDQIDGAGRHQCIFVRSSSFCRNDVPNSPENTKENRAARARQFGAQPVLNPSALDISNVLQHGTPIVRQTSGMRRFCLTFRDADTSVVTTHRFSGEARAYALQNASRPI